MERIGFIGVGIMGKPMAINLLKAGYPVVVHDVNRKAVEQVAEKGAASATCGKTVAEQSDVVITMLPDSPEVEDVVLGPDGVAEGVHSGMLFIDMSTIAPATSKKISSILSEKGVASLDAPVSGGEVGAKAGTLSIMVGGEQSAFDRALPILQVMGKNIVHIGNAGAGQVAKACNQIIVGMTIQALAEAMTLAKKSGVELEKVREALLGGFAQSRILDLHGKRIIEGNYKPGFKVRLHRKDMNIALQTGRALSVPLPGSALVATQMDAMLAQGNGDLDHSALALFLQQLSNVSG
ncbi:2-hydroxy-3-oxopropionate reductase [candidate division BRC1 bacterium SM23_51]|nr:MAG: 2-hydroxy-3-oxopropionate reductase [candidate division BRC1 bacterium SM23_51]